MSDEIQVLNETFFVSNESCVFTFDGCRLDWRDNSVLVRNFISVDYVHTGNCCKSRLFLFRKAAHKCRGHDTIIIHYAQCQKRNKLRLNSVKIQGENDRITAWLCLLKTALGKCSDQRPNNYIVFINPFSGRQNGVELFTKKVKPIFDMANIDTCVVVTKNRGDFEKVICSGIDCYDAILAIGGDGTVSEIVNCLINSQTDYAVPDPDDDGENVPKITIPIAIIPCGSTDCVAYTLNGTRDTESSVLYAILGKRSYFDVCRVMSQTGLTRFFVSVFTYGYLSDLIRESEKFRWMGPIRYNYAGLLTLMRSKEYYGQLDLTGQQFMRKSSEASLKPKKPMKKKSRSLSLCVVPILPTVEPGPECLDERMICRDMSPKRRCKTPKCDNSAPKNEAEEGKKEADQCEPVEAVNKCEDETPTCEGDVPKSEDDGKKEEDVCAKGEDNGSKGEDNGLIGEENGSKGEDDGSKGEDDGSKGEDNGSKGEDNGSKGENDCSNEGDDGDKGEDVTPTGEDLVEARNDLVPVPEDSAAAIIADESPKEIGNADETEQCTCSEDNSVSENVICDGGEEAPKEEDPKTEGPSVCKDVVRACMTVVSQETMPPPRMDSVPSCPDEKPEEQYSIKGRYFLIACANISCSSELTPNGIAPHCTTGDGNMNIVLFQPNSICDLYKIYTRLTSKDRDFLLSDLPFVTIYKTKQVKINVMQKDIDKENSANCDGELFPGSIVDIKLFQGIIQFISRRPGEPSE